MLLLLSSIYGQLLFLESYHPVGLCLDAPCMGRSGSVHFSCGSWQLMECPCIAQGLKKQGAGRKAGTMQDFSKHVTHLNHLLQHFENFVLQRLPLTLGIEKGNYINRGSTAMHRMQSYISEHDLKCEPSVFTCTGCCSLDHDFKELCEYYTFTMLKIYSNLIFLTIIS